ncbi:SMI1/KNR4 family protein [Nannocystis pusilla]|uniref:SMI1/KNR4 family protein n=1 Tax=Nannocystis pusilla TaxID=889268 RepID=A0ABS7TRD2_9BACT|nr:SMI1/KNR4 family protein [Nannocystis pusilla]MBZ5710780.1 SMI1/KNR4 family protein [Nannocystis pusilla]
MPRATNWKKLLKQLNDDLLAEAQGESDFCLAPEVYERVIADHWLGRPPASEEAIRAAEVRLGISLPADFRAFLAVSNGWYGCLMFPNGLAQLLPVEEIQWSHASEADVDSIVEDHGPDLKGVDLARETLLIGDGDGNESIFLHPGKGPWGVCNWDHEIGLKLFPSFEALMRSRL